MRLIRLLAIVLFAAPAFAQDGQVYFHRQGNVVVGQLPNQPSVVLLGLSIPAATRSICSGRSGCCVDLVTAAESLLLI
jgi:hypothetical protein